MRILTKNLFLLLSSLVVFSLAGSFLLRAKSTVPPNIIVIFSDDHALQAISAYGSPYLQTPHIDRLAREGILFRNAFVTNSICAPSRATFLTGKYSHANGHKDNKTRFDAGQDMFPKHLQQAGYQTAWIGKWHLQNNPQYFDYWEVLPGQGQYYNPDFIQMDEQRTRTEGYATTIITDKALTWLKAQRDKSKPFCLIIGQKAPHRTWMPDTTDLREFDGKKFPLPATFYDNYVGRLAAQKQKMSISKSLQMIYDLKVEGAAEPFVKRMNPAQLRAWQAYYGPLSDEFKAKNLSGRALDEWKFQRYMHDYLSCVRSLDNSVGRVLQYLDKEGLTNQTLVIYTSDQGVFLGEHGWFDKRFMYEESMRTPLLARFPSHIKAGTVNDGLVINTDFAPTLLKVAGLTTPADVQGHSFLPIATMKQRKAIYYHYYEYPNEHGVMPHFGVRTSRYKLIRFYGDGDFWELYDLKNDPQELKNQYGSNVYRNVQNSLRKELDLQIQELNDTKAAEILVKRRVKDSNDPTSKENR